MAKASLESALAMAFLAFGILRMESICRTSGSIDAGARYRAVAAWDTNKSHLSVMADAGGAPVTAWGDMISRHGDLRENSLTWAKRHIK